jgi:type IV pilus assembly protein PilN
VARINLLPWRETKRRRRRREFAAMALAALAAALALGGGIHLHVERLIAAQNARNDFLREQISKLDTEISEIRQLEKTKASLLARMDVIQQLQLSRPEIVRLFDALVTAIPEGVVLTALEQTGRTIVLEGRARSNAGVSAFMRNIDGSGWIGDPRLLLIEHKDKTGTGLNHFKLQFTQTRPVDDRSEADTA